MGLGEGPRPDTAIRRQAPGLAMALALLSGFLSGSAAPALAQEGEFETTAWRTEQQIRRIDPAVRAVRSSIPAETGTRSACGPIPAGELVAFYCPAERRVVISRQTLSAAGSRHGKAAIAVIVAHEFAHARQHAVPGFASDVVWSAVVDELQADCAAGTYLNTLLNDPGSLLQEQTSNPDSHLNQLLDWGKTWLNRN